MVTRNTGRWWQLFAMTMIAAVPVVVVLFVAREISMVARESKLRQIQWGQEELNRQLSDLKVGKGNTLYLYDTRGTNDLLHQVEGLSR